MAPRAYEEYALAQSLIHLFEQRVNRSGPQPALRTKADRQWVEMSWRTWFETSDRLAAGLIALGVEAHDRILLASQTRAEWAIMDMAIMMARATCVPLYPSTTAESAQHIARECDARVAIVEDPVQLAKLTPILDDPDTSLTHIVFFDEDALEAVEGTPRRVSIEDIEQAVQWRADEVLIREDALDALGRRTLSQDAQVVSRRREAIEPEDAATLVYTSGTMGEARGVIITHANAVAEVDGLTKLNILSADDRQLVVLPLAHIFARITLWAAIGYGIESVMGEGMAQLMANFREVEPTVFAGVPHIFENMWRELEARLTSRAQSGAVVTASRVMLEQAREISRARQHGASLTMVQRGVERLLEPALFRQVRRIFGGKLRLFISGGAPLNPEIAEFFHACGLLVLEGYGLTESCGAATFNAPDDFRFGSVGRPLPHVDITLDRDGEILIRAQSCTPGYDKDPEATAALLDEDGWLHTGDLGRFDADGYLYVAGRKKNLIITAGGKNVAPLVIEQALEEAPFIDHAMIFGDDRHYLTALVTLDHEQVRARLGEIEEEPGAELIEDVRVRQLVEDHIDAVNEERPSFEAIRKFAILGATFSLQSGELTPTLKLKRATVEARYHHIVDALYDESSRASVS